MTNGDFMKFWDEVISTQEVKPKSNNGFGKLYSYKEEDDKLIILFPVPGLAKEDVKLSYQGDVFTLTPKKSNAFVTTENKSVVVDTDVYDMKKLKAKLENGMMTVTIPIIEEYKKDVEIE